MLELQPKDGNSSVTKNQKAPIQHLRTQKWYGWITLNQGGPKKVMLTGEVEGRNAGQRGILLKKRATCTEACGENILCLELALNQDTGDWVDVDCWISLHFQEYMMGTFYTMVHIYTEGRLIEKIPIDVLPSGSTDRPF